jgi:hypothetical protein
MEQLQREDTVLEEKKRSTREADKERRRRKRNRERIEK